MTPTLNSSGLAVAEPRTTRNAPITIIIAGGRLATTLKLKLIELTQTYVGFHCFPKDKYITETKGQSKGGRESESV